MTDFDTINFFKDETVVADPYPYFDHLREQCPVHRESRYGVMMVTGYDEACAIYNDHDTFSSCNSVSGPFSGIPIPDDADDMSESIEQYRDRLPFGDQIPTFDPPKHKAHRGLLMRLLTPKRLRENEDFMWRNADRVIDEFIAKGRCEFVAEFAKPFTLYVIAELLGVPVADHETFRQELHGDHDPHDVLGATEGPRMGHSPLDFLYDRFTAYVEDRRREPRRDVLNDLATANFPDGSMPETIDVVRVAANLFSAGQDTTVRLITTALKLLGERPDLQRLLRQQPERIPNFVEECLRTESPVKGDFRLARIGTTVDGVEIPAGTTVMVVNGAANRDPKRFDDPNEFQVDRSNVREHLAFGRGIHACPGGSLARSEARVCVEHFLQRTSDIRISESQHGPAVARRYRYDPTFIMRGLTELHLEFTPTG